MKCPYCNKEVDRKAKLCRECGGDISIYRKIRYASACLYNKGLAQIEASDLDGAVKSLRMSILFDGRNISALNLLGLVYFEKGHIAEACKQWVISMNIKEENNPAVRYFDDFKNDARNFDKLNDAVKIYNDAIKYLKQGNDDLAIIRLKKAIDINPNLIEAYNLLTVAYMKAGNKQEALKIAERALAKDANNPDTLRYLKELSGEVKRRRIVPSKTTIENVERIEPGRRYDYTRPTMINTRKNSLGAEIAVFAAGLVCAGLLMYFLFMPAAVIEQKNELEAANAKVTQIQQEKAAIQNENNAKIEELEAEINELKVKADGYDAIKQVADKTEVVKKAQAQYEAGSVKEAANLLYSLDLTGVTDEGVISQYNNLKQKVYEDVSIIFHKEGEAAYKSENYTEALNLFTSCLQYAVTDEEKYTAEYRLGCIARNQGDAETAKKYFTDVKANHPYSKYRSWADTELRNL